MSETAAAIEKLTTREARQEADDRSLLGFWIYVMTDCVLFASLFAVYAVLRNNNFGGPTGQQLFHPSYILLETFALLTSSFSCGLGILAARSKAKSQVLLWFGVTFLLGLLFLVLELTEFRHLTQEGNSWRRSGFLSSYFTLVGTHGLHITLGLTWMGTLLKNIWKRGLTRKTTRQLTMLSIFWHFLDIVWIFIFTIVYMMGIA